MLRAFTIGMCLVICASSAQAAQLSINDMHLFFSQQGPDPLMVPPPDYCSNPTVAPGETVYLWAKVAADDTDRWVAVDLEFRQGVDMEYATGAEGEMYDPEWQSGALQVSRWHPESYFDPAETGGRVLLISFGALYGGMGLGTDAEDPLCGMVEEGGELFIYYAFGELTFPADPSGAYPVYVSMGMAGTLKGATEAGDSLIYYGCGDDALPNSLDYSGVCSEVADLYVTPEPGSLGLMAVALLWLRRR